MTELAFREVAVGLDGALEPLFWVDGTPGTVPDAPGTWDLIWAHRDRLLAIAHTHPGRGVPVPSAEDLSTFAAIELGLGRRLLWYIATADREIRTRWDPSRGAYGLVAPMRGNPHCLPFLEPLRLRSARAR